MAPKKILVCGFPHCGTTILKNKIGDCDNCEEYIDEVSEATIMTAVAETANSKSEYVVYKSPFLMGGLEHPEIFNSHPLNDFKIVIILRNPLQVYSSLLRRFNGMEFTYINKPATADEMMRFIRTDGVNNTYLPTRNDLRDFEIICKAFESYKQLSNGSVFCIRYEDLFTDDHMHLKTLLDNLGLRYDDSLFSSRKRDYQLFKDTKYENVQEKPTLETVKANISHDVGDRIDYNKHLRTWQINQPFENTDTLEKIELPESWANEILNSEICNRLWSNEFGAYKNR